MVYLWRAVDDEGTVLDIVVQRKRNTKAALRLLLAFLAPDIQLAILSGTQPRGLLLKDLIYQAIPTAWPEQRKLLGFPA